MNKTCKNCKHWTDKDTWGHEHPYDFKNHKCCNHSKMKDFYLDDINDDDAIYVGQDVDFIILTGKDFGCIHFEKNE